MFKKTRKTLLLGIFILIICLGMLTGTTYAWLSDLLSSGSNVIQAGNLDISVEYTLDGENWNNLDGAKDLFKKDAWEPGSEEIVALKIENKGVLSFKYKALLNLYEENIGKTINGADIKLTDILIVKTLVKETDENGKATVKNAFNDVNSVVYDKSELFSASEVLSKDITLLPGLSKYLIVKVYIPENLDLDMNNNGTDIPKIEFGINVVATQFTHEEDTFNNQYDVDAIYPNIIKINESFYFTIEDSFIKNGTFYSNNVSKNEILLDGNETTVNMDVTSEDAAKWNENNIPSFGNVFGSADGSSLTVRDLTIEGKMMSNMAGYYDPNGTKFNTTLNNIKIVDAKIVSGLDGLSPALFSYGDTTLNNCEIKGTTSNSGNEVFDIVIAEGKVTATDSEIGSVYMSEDKSVLVVSPGTEIDYINCEGDEEMWVFIKLGSKVNKIDAYGKNTHIIYEKGADIGDINVTPGNEDNIVEEDGKIVTTLEEIRRGIKNGDYVLVYNEIILPKATEILLYADKGNPINIDGKGQTFVLNGNPTGNESGVTHDYGYLGFIPYDGEDAIVENIRATGVGFVEVGHHKQSDGGNYTINNLVIENLVGSFYSTNGGNKIVSAFAHYGNAVLTDCVMTGITTQHTGYKPYDAVFVNGTTTKIIGGKYGVVYVAHQGGVIIDGGAVIDIIDDYAIKAGPGNLTIKKDVKIGTINLYDYSASYLAYKVFKIEAGAQVGAIVYNGQTYTVEQWLAAYPSTEYKG